MSLVTTSVRRPIFALMLSLAIFVFGVICYQRVGVQSVPNVTFPVISISTSYNNASPSIVNQQITKPIQQAINTIPGVQSVESTSSAGNSEVDVTFSLKKNINRAYNEIQTHIAQVVYQLPNGAQKPVISKFQSSGQPILQLVLSGELTTAELTHYANKVKHKLQSVDGVGQVSVSGGNSSELHIQLNVQKMAALNITPQEVQNAFAARHFKMSGGAITTGAQSYNLNIDLKLTKEEQFSNLVVAYRHNAPIRVRDIATVKIISDNSQAFSQYNDEPVVGINLIKLPDANTIQVVNQAKEKIAKDIVPHLLPSSVKLNVVYDDSTQIKAVANSLQKDIWISALMAAVVVLLFLRSLRSTLIVIATIPVSLLGAVVAIYAFGFTFNILTLLSMILLVGVVVDDAIVVLENIYRRREQDASDDVKSLTISAAQQVMLAALASTLTLICIFTPVVFMGGTIGLFFKSFAIVVSIGVLISLFVALTLTPMLCSQFLSVKQQHGAIYQSFDRAFKLLDNGYQRLLKLILKARWLVVLVMILLIGLSYPIFKNIGKGFLPTPSNNSSFSLFFQTPPGSTLDYSKERTQKVVALLKQYKGIKSVYTNVSPSYASIDVHLKLSLSNKAANDLMNNAYAGVSQIAGINSGFTPPGGESLQFNLQSGNFAGLMSVSKQFLQKLKTTPGFEHSKLKLSPMQPQYDLQVNRRLANTLGVTPQQIAQTLTLLTNGIKLGTYPAPASDAERNIRLTTQHDSINSPKDLSKIYLRNTNNELVRMDTVASLGTSLAPSSISQKDFLYSANFTVNTKKSLGKAITQVEQLAKRNLPPGYSFKLAGNAAQMKKTNESVIIAFAIGFLLIYMVLASQFNSFIQPLIIMLAQPLAIIGGIFALWITSQTLNIYSMIGLLLLIGLVAKNSILLIDLTNQLRATGLSVKQALLEACPKRMRPVLMTSLTIILAMLPPAFSHGAAASSDQPLAIAIIGGMISSTLLTLIIVPAVYSLIYRAK